LDSGVDFDKRYAAKSRLDVVSKSFTRVAQEILLKQENTSSSLVLGTLADATTNGNGHCINASKNVILDDFNQLLTLAKRINTAWTGGTPENRIKGITDMLVSPEVVQGLRAMAYNPINTLGTAAGTAAVAAGPVAATDGMRDEIYRNAGIPEFYGVSLMEINELGPSQKFQLLWKSLGGKVNGSSGAVVGKADDLAIGIDRSRDSLFRAVALDSETGSEFTLLADDQYSVRQQKIGYYGSIEEGRMILDNRVVTGITVTN
jgi:hypothetical protein